MNNAIEAVLLFLIRKRIVGGKHFPEKKLINSKIRRLNKKQRKEFDYKYKQLINDGFFFRLKKRTGKGSDWHISLNPDKIEEVKEKISRYGEK